MIHWGVEVMDLECVNGNWQMPAFPSSLMVCDLETGEALYPALGGAGGRTMNTVLTLAAVAAVTFVTYGAATKFIGPVKAAMVGGSKAAAAKFSGGVPLTSALMGQAGSSYFWGAAGSLLAGQVAGGLVGSLMEPSVPDLPSYNASPYKYMADYEDPAMQAKLQQDTQNELLKQSVSLENRRRQRYVTFREELMPLGAAGELIPQSAIDKPELLGA